VMKWKHKGAQQMLLLTPPSLFFLAKSQNFEEALQLAQRMKSAECKPDTVFYNSLMGELVDFRRPLIFLRRCQIQGSLVIHLPITP